MNVRIPKAVRIVELESAPFKRYADAKAWTKDHGIIGKMSDVDTGGAGFAHKAYSYEICNIEILKGYVGSNARPRDRISMSTGILLNGVCDVNGAPLIRG